MSARPSLGFDDEEEIVPAKPKPDLLDLSGFKPTPASRPDKANVAESAAKAQFKSRESRPEPPPVPLPARTQRRHRTGRCAQLNLKLRPETIADFYAVADAQGWVLGEAFEKAVELLKEHQDGPPYSVSES